MEPMKPMEPMKRITRGEAWWQKDLGQVWKSGSRNDLRQAVFGNVIHLH